MILFATFICCGTVAAGGENSTHMKLCIDASNIRAGGGITHLAEMLRVAQPANHGFDEVIVWGGAMLLNRLTDHPWLSRVHDPALDGSLFMRTYWQRFKVDELAHASGCSVVFFPGSLFGGRFRPFVTMSQNMLPFERNESRRFGYSLHSLRYWLLKRSQLATFCKASGLIFLSQHAQSTISPHLQGRNIPSAIIPHGVEKRFRCQPRPQKEVQACSKQRPFRLLYVSIINLYKHQWHVAEAVGRFHAEGLPIAVDFVGPAYEPALHLLRQAQLQWDPRGEFIRYVGPIPYAELPECYHQADGFVFASSCENMPNILLEAMASGLPIACSDRGPMPEMLGDAGIFFDPEQPTQIADALRALLVNTALRQQSAHGAYERAQHYSWQRCADETFDFLACIARNWRLKTDI